MKVTILAATLAVLTSSSTMAFAESFTVVDQACYSKKLAACVAAADASLAPRPVDQNCNADWKQEVELAILGAGTTRCVPTRESISAAYHICEVRTIANITAGENCLRTVDLDVSVGNKINDLSTVLRQEFVNGLKVVFEQMREDAEPAEPPSQP